MARTFRRFDRLNARDFADDWGKKVREDNRFVGTDDGSLVTHDGISETSYRSNVKKEEKRRNRREAKRSLKDW